MFARIATFEGVDIAAEAQNLDAVYERLQPLFREMEGYRGVLELGDRESGKALTITLFDSEANMRAAEPIFEDEMPRRLAELMEGFSGRRSSVERYEVLLNEQA